MIRNKSAYKYETTYKRPYQITQMWTNGMVTQQIGATINRLNISHIKHYVTSTDVYYDHL